MTIVWFYLHETSRRDKSIETESRLADFGDCAVKEACPQTGIRELLGVMEKL